MGISITLTIPTPRHKRAPALRRGRRNQQHQHHQPSPSPSPPPDSAAKHERPRRPRRTPRIPNCLPCISVRLHRTNSSVSISSSTTPSSSTSSTTSSPAHPRPSPTATLPSPPLSTAQQKLSEQQQQKQKQVSVVPPVPIISLSPKQQNRSQSKQILPITVPQPSPPPPPPSISPPLPPQTNSIPNTQQESIHTSPSSPPPLRLPRSSSTPSTTRRSLSNSRNNRTHSILSPSSNPPAETIPRTSNNIDNDIFNDTSRVAAIASITASATAAAVTATLRTFCPDIFLPISSSPTSIRNNETNQNLLNNTNTRWLRNINQCLVPNNQLVLSRGRNSQLNDNSDNQDQNDNPADIMQRSGITIFMNDPRNGTFVEISMRGQTRNNAVEESSRPTSTSTSQRTSTVLLESDDEAAADQDVDQDRSINDDMITDVTAPETPEQYIERMKKKPPNKFVEKAVEAFKGSRSFNTELFTSIAEELEELLSSTSNIEAETSSPQMDPPFRVGAHYCLMLYYKDQPKPNREKIMNHCRTGLVCLPGSESKLPEEAAEMHCTYAEQLAKDVPGNQSLVREVIEHTNSAKAALYVKHNSELSYRVALVTGQVYATRWDEPICDNLVSAYEAYHSALEIIKYSSDERPDEHPEERPDEHHRDEQRRDEYFRIGCFCIDFILRFLRHQRLAKSNPKSICNHNGNTACRRDLSLSPVLPHFTIEYALEFTNKLRTILNQCIDAEDESRSNYIDCEYKHGANLSAIHECMARCYLERSELYRDNAAKDLAKACHHLRRALATHHEQKDLAMQRYSFLHDLLYEIEQKQEEAGRITSGLTSNESDDTHSINSSQASLNLPQDQPNSDNEDKDSNQDEKNESKSEGSQKHESRTQAESEEETENEILSTTSVG